MSGGVACEEFIKQEHSHIDTNIFITDNNDKSFIIFRIPPLMFRNLWHRNPKAEAHTLRGFSNSSNLPDGGIRENPNFL